MVASNTSPQNNVVVVHSCDDSQVINATKKWLLTPDGNIINQHSGLALTARSSRWFTILTLESSTYSTSQGWRPGDDVSPIVASIVGLNDMCLQGNGDGGRVWLEKCIVGKEEQSWALYSDGSIRVSGDRGLCVTFDGNNSMDRLVVIRKCEGSSNQRWVFKADGSILNPNSTLVMDVKEANVNLQQIVLNRSTGSANQKWVILF